MTVLKMPNGDARKYTKVGGYPLFYVARGGAVCPCCAASEYYHPEELLQAVNWEDQDLECVDCQEPIESAYQGRCPFSEAGCKEHCYSTEASKA